MILSPGPVHKAKATILSRGIRCRMCPHVASFELECNILREHCVAYVRRGTWMRAPTFRYLSLEQFEFEFWFESVDRKRSQSGGGGMQSKQSKAAERALACS